MGHSSSRLGARAFQSGRRKPLAGFPSVTRRRLELWRRSRFSLVLRHQCIHNLAQPIAADNPRAGC